MLVCILQEQEVIGNQVGLEGRQEGRQEVMLASGKAQKRGVPTWPSPTKSAGGEKTAATDGTARKRLATQKKATKGKSAISK